MHEQIHKHNLYATAKKMKRLLILTNEQVNKSEHQNPGFLFVQVSAMLRVFHTNALLLFCFTHPLQTLSGSNTP